MRLGIEDEEGGLNRHGRLYIHMLGRDPRLEVSNVSTC